MNKIKNKIIIAFLVAFLTIVPVKKSEAMAQCCGETAMLMLILFTMQMNFMELYMYLISGIGDVGTGIAGTTSANSQSQMSHNEAAQSNAEAHDKAIQRTREAEMIVADRVVADSPNPAHCSEETIVKNMGTKGDSVDASIAGAKAAGKIAADLSKSRNLKNELAHSAAIIESSTSLYCSQADQDAKRCSKSIMPAANERVQSLFTPAHDYLNIAEAKKQTSTFDYGAANGPQSKAAIEAASLITGKYSPPVIPKAVSETPLGKMYNAKYKIYEARLAPSEMILANIIARRTPSGSTSKTWQQSQSVFSRVFAGKTMPSSPSETEAVQLEVYKRFADSDWLTEVKKDDDMARVMQERTVTSSVELKILLDIHARLEENLAVRSAILTQLVNPVSKLEVETAAASAYRAKE